MEEQRIDFLQSFSKMKTSLMEEEKFLREEAHDFYDEKSIEEEIEDDRINSEEFFFMEGYLSFENVLKI